MLKPRVPVKEVVPTLALSLAELRREYEPKSYAGRRCLVFDVRDMPNCCAFDVIGNFHLPFAGEITDKHIGESCFYIHQNTRQTAILATTITKSTRVNEVLERCGFKEVSRTKNGNTRNTVILWQVDIKR